MKQLKMFDKKICEICGKEHTNGGTICSDKCAKIWAEKYLKLKDATNNKH